MEMNKHARFKNREYLKKNIVQVASNFWNMRWVYKEDIIAFQFFKNIRIYILYSRLNDEVFFFVFFL